MSKFSDVNEPVPHRCVRSVPDKHGATYAQVRQTGTTSCRLCGLCAKVLEAFADGFFPAFFQGAQDKAQRAEILKKLDFFPRWSDNGSSATMHLYFMGASLGVFIHRDSNEKPAFAVEGVSFPWVSRRFLGEERELVVAPVPCFSNRHYSDKSLERAESWLSQCLDQHSCGKSDYYPKRLLNLREDPIRLFETNDIKSFQESYVCLSHRWGGPEHKRLTSTVVNLHNHMKGIAWDDIPKTFQDAITVCRRLSVSYLWIDTLCILQAYEGISGEDRAKTEADFAAENSAMARIYQNSQFTICASMSTSMDSGIFPRKYDHPIEVTGDDGAEATLRAMVVHSHDTPPTDLETRGWTYQEYLLPPRVLEFGPFDISWRCQMDYTCECADLGLTSNWDWRKTLAKQARPPRKVNSEAEQWWVRTVRHYTARNLTDHRDKLPALSGLAQIYRKVTDDTYLAGLWKSSLPYNLCWYHCSGDYHFGDLMGIGIGRRPPSFLDRAPSWSWASIDALQNAQCRTWWPGTVEFDDNLIYYDPCEPADLREVCTIYEVSVQPRTGDSFGEICPEGFLKLGVTLISAEIDTKAQGDELFSYMDRFKGSAAWTLNHFNDDETHVKFCLPDCEMKDDRLRLGDEVHCAPILERVSEAQSERGCLVLKRLDDQKYQRVGFCILLKENPNYHHWAKSARWKSTAQELSSYALQWSVETEARITIV